MSPVAQALTVGTPIAVLACAISYAQRYAWRKPAPTPRAAELRAAAAMMLPMPQLGIRVCTTRFIYANSTGRCLGPLDGATGRLAPAVPVTGLKPKTGWFTITFADGTTWTHRYALANQKLAAAQLARFQAMTATTPPGAWRRTRPAHLTP
jgi:hypothetical protein